MRRRQFAAVAGLACVAFVAVLPACGSKTDEKARAAGILPATALGYLSVNFEPSIEQQRHLLSIRDEFPEAEAEADETFAGARDQLLEEMFEDTGIEFERDIEPWLGDEVAIGVLPSVLPDGIPHPLLLVESDDTGAAEAAMKRLESGGELPGPWQVVDDFVVLSLDGADESLDAVTAEVERDSGGLAASDKFNSVVGELHGDRLVLGYIDGERALNAIRDYSGALGEIPIDMGAVAAGPVAFDLHAASKALVLEGVARATGANRGQPLEFDFPAGTVASFSLVGLGDALREAATQLPPGASQELGVDIQEDLLSWIGDRVTVVVGQSATDMPNFGLLIEVTDRAKAEKVLPLLEQFAGAGLAGAFGGGDESGAVDPSTRPSFELQDDQLLVAFPGPYVSQLTGVKASGKGDPAVLHLDIDADALAELVDEPELAEVLDRITARVGRAGSFDRFELRVTFG